MTSTVTSAGPEETIRAAHTLAGRLSPGAVIGLRGGLGAGKTVFAKGLAEALGVAETVTSQSYTLIAEYEGRLPFFHADLYRLQRAAEIDNVGIEEYFDRGGITVVEWCDRAPAVLPPDAVMVTITIEPDDLRRIEIEEP